MSWSAPGTVIWRSRRKLAAGEIDEDGVLPAALSSSPVPRPLQHHGHGHHDEHRGRSSGPLPPGCAQIPAAYGERGQIAYETGRRIVDMAYEDLRPSDILTRAAFLNAIRVISAIGGSSNAQPHMMAMARHAGVDLRPEDWMAHGYDIPLLVNMQPAGDHLSERFHRAGGVPAVMWELLQAGRLDGDCSHRHRPHDGARTSPAAKPATAT